MRVCDEVRGRIGKRGRAIARSTRRPPVSPSEGDRIIVALCVATLSGLIVWLHARSNATFRSDFDQIWFAARALWEHRDPYPLIGPGREFAYPWRFYYPLSAPVSVAPLGLLPLLAARIAFAALSGGTLAYLVLRDGWHRVILFLSPAYLVHLIYLQWVVLLTGALYEPTFGVFASAKPNIGAATFAGLRSRRAALRFCAAAFLPFAIAFVLQPSWPFGWLEALRSSEHFEPVVALPGGALLLLALLRWRRWEAKFLVAFALIPQTFGIVSALPLLLIPKSWRGTLSLTLLSFAPSALSPLVLTQEMPFGEKTHLVGVLSLLTVYLPALWFVMRLSSGPEREAVTSIDGAPRVADAT